MARHLGSVVGELIFKDIAYCGTRFGDNFWDAQMGDSEVAPGCKIV